MLELMAIVADVNLGSPPEQKQFRPCKMKIVWKQVHEKSAQPAERWHWSILVNFNFAHLAFLDAWHASMCAFLDA